MGQIVGRNTYLYLHLPVHTCAPCLPRVPLCTPAFPGSPYAPLPFLAPPVHPCLHWLWPHGLGSVPPLFAPQFPTCELKGWVRSSHLGSLRSLLPNSAACKVPDPGLLLGETDGDSTA